VVGGGVGIAVAASGGGGGNGDDYNVVGTWNLIFDWNCDGTSGSTSITLNEGGSFSGDSGNWTLDGSSITMVFIGSGVTATYRGTVTSDTHMEGTMNNTYGESGCWSANKTSSGMQQSISYGESNKCRADTPR